MAARLHLVVVAVRVFPVHVFQHGGELLETDMRLVDNVGVNACRHDVLIISKVAHHLEQQCLKITQKRNTGNEDSEGKEQGGHSAWEGRGEVNCGRRKG